MKTPTRFARVNSSHDSHFSGGVIVLALVLLLGLGLGPANVQDGDAKEVTVTVTLMMLVSRLLPAAAEVVDGISAIWFHLMDCGDVRMEVDEKTTQS